MNPRRAPTRVGLRHRTDQRADIGGQRRSPEAASAVPGPPQPKAPSVPGDDSLWLDDHERRSHPAQRRESITQSQRSVFASGTRRGRVRRSTASCCRKANISTCWFRLAQPENSSSAKGEQGRQRGHGSSLLDRRPSFNRCETWAFSTISGAEIPEAKASSIGVDPPMSGDPHAAGVFAHDGMDALSVEAHSGESTRRSG